MNNDEWTKEKIADALESIAASLQRITEELITLNRFNEYRISTPHRQKEMIEEFDVPVRFPRKHGIDMGDDE